MRPKTIALAMGLLLMGSAVAAADKSYGPGASDSEIKLGQSIPYSGPASAFSVVGRVQVAYFKMLNAQGGINGRKIELIMRDDGGNPGDAVRVAEELVSREKVDLLAGGFLSNMPPFGSGRQFDGVIVYGRAYRATR